jgi:hypothetical protein
VIFDLVYFDEVIFDEVIFDEVSDPRFDIHILQNESSLKKYFYYETSASFYKY